MQKKKVSCKKNFFAKIFCFAGFFISPRIIVKKREINIILLENYYANVIVLEKEKYLIEKILFKIYISRIWKINLKVGYNNLIRKIITHLINFKTKLYKLKMI
jgi:hypothetical protein